MNSHTRIEMMGGLDGEYPRAWHFGQLTQSSYNTRFFDNHPPIFDSRLARQVIVNRDNFRQLPQFRMIRHEFGVPRKWLGDVFDRNLEHLEHSTQEEMHI